MDASNMRSSRFTILNEGGHMIVVSRSLLEKLSKKPGEKQPAAVPTEKECTRLADSTPPEPNTSKDFYGETMAVLRDAYESKLEQQNRQWQSRVQKVEELNDRLLKLNSAKLDNEIDGLMQKHVDNQHGYAESPCLATENALKQCYSLNGKKSLLCAEQVNRFVECVRLAGQSKYLSEY